MKTREVLYFFLFAGLAVCLFIGCKNKTKTEDKTPVEKMLTVNKDSLNFSWTAYKTTDKTPVKGWFKRIDFTRIPVGNTVEEALDGLSFSIPINSLFTNDPVRDQTLLINFFGKMLNTELISGVFELNEQGSSIALSMNGVTKKIPIDLSVDDRRVSFSNTIQLQDWNLETALKSISTACHELHKGSDGVSKTWDEVKIDASIVLSHWVTQLSVLQAEQVYAV